MVGNSDTGGPERVLRTIKTYWYWKNATFRCSVYCSLHFLNTIWLGSRRKNHWPFWVAAGWIKFFFNVALFYLQRIRRLRFSCILLVYEAPNFLTKKPWGSLFHSLRNAGSAPLIMGNNWPWKILLIEKVLRDTNYHAHIWLLLAGNWPT